MILAARDKNKRNSERLLDLSASGQHPWQQPESIECNRECNRDRLLNLSASGQHPWQQPEFIERNRECNCDRLLDLSASGQHPLQQPELIERNRENHSKRTNELVAQGKHNFATENPAKKRLKKLFEDSESIHYISIYDKTGEYHRQWPNKAWPPKKNSIIFEEDERDGGDTCDSSSWHWLHLYLTSAHQKLIDGCVLHTTDKCRVKIRSYHATIPYGSLQ